MSSDPNWVLPDRYEYVSVLETGQSSVVYKAYDERTHRNVVAKVPRKDVPAADPLAFDSEVRNTLKLEGKSNLLRLWDAGPKSDEMFTYMVVQWVGDRLDPTKPWPLKLALDVAIGILVGIDSAHRCGYLLNNVCPSNIVLDDDHPADPVLIDFQAACSLYEADKQAGAILDPDVVPYMAPERHTGAPPSIASDIYSAGAVLHSMLTSEDQGSRSHQQEPGTDTFRRVIEGIVLRATAANPDDRYAGAKEMQAALEEVRALYQADETRRIVPPGRPEADPFVSLAVQPKTLDFGEIRLGQTVPDPSRSFQVRSDEELNVDIRRSEPWLDIHPDSVIVREGTETVTVSLRVHELPQGQESRARIEVRAEGRPPKYVDCRVRCAAGVDLVLIIDTIGDAARLRARCDFAKRVLTAALQVMDDLGELQVGVLAYGDHGTGDYIHPTGQRPLHCYNLNNPASACAALAQLTPVENRDFEAALEDAVAALRRLSWRPWSSHVFVAIGNRPPHPVGIGTYQQIASPSQHDWQQLLADARRRLRLKGISVVDPIYWSDSPLPVHAEEYTDVFWRDLGDIGRVTYDATEPDKVVDMLAASIRHT